MSYNIMSYQNIVGLKNTIPNDPSVLLIGAGYIANEYAKALSELKIKNVTIISATTSSSKIANQYGFQHISGGYEETLPSLPIMDLVIIATPVLLLLPATKLALENGQKNILVEKPGSLYSQDLISLSQKFPEANVKIAFNRLQFQNFHLLKKLSDDDGGITSCHFTFTEWIDKIDFEKFPSLVLEKWGIANSLHVISMAFELIGFPKNLSPYQFGNLEWHPSGSVFVGSGMSEMNIPFSYHSDWNSSGRWGIEIFTKNHAFRLIPLEELHVCTKNSTTWEKISFKNYFPEIKFGVMEQILLMLENKNLCEQFMISLEKASEHIKIAEKIFGYKIN